MPVLYHQVGPQFDPANGGLEKSLKLKRVAEFIAVAVDNVLDVLCGLMSDNKADKNAQVKFTSREPANKE